MHQTVKGADGWIDIFHPEGKLDHSLQSSESINGRRCYSFGRNQTCQTNESAVLKGSPSHSGGVCKPQPRGTQTNRWWGRLKSRNSERISPVRDQPDGIWASVPLATAFTAIDQLWKAGSWSGWLSFYTCSHWIELGFLRNSYQIAQKLYASYSIRVAYLTWIEKLTPWKGLWRGIAWFSSQCLIFFVLNMYVILKYFRLCYRPVTWLTGFIWLSHYQSFFLQNVVHQKHIKAI